MSTPRTYDHGDLVRVYAEFENTAGELTDPDTVTARLLRPDTTTANLDVENPSTGIYYAEVDTLAITDPAQADGDWTVRIQGTGTTQAAAEHTFRVRTRIVPAA